jgi:hypothetical protein
VLSDVSEGLVVGAGAVTVNVTVGSGGCADKILRLQS